MPESDSRGELPPLRRPAAVLAWSENACEGAAADAAAGAGPFLALWRPLGTTAALGISQNAERELDCEAVRRDGVALLRRQSGGGAVLLYEGVLCWEAWAGLDALAGLAPNGETGIHEAYAGLTGPVRGGVASLGLEVIRAGVSDLSVRSGVDGEVRKVAGTAQFRKRDWVLVHGCLLVTAEVGRLSRYLAPPSVMPEYRAGRTHRAFCASVKELLGGGGGSDEALMGQLAEAVSLAARAGGWRELVPPEELPPAAAGLERRKYLSPEWNWEKRRLF